MTYTEEQLLNDIYTEDGFDEFYMQFLETGIAA